MDFCVLVTYGPAIQNENILQKIDGLGPCIYRINGAHVEPEDIVSTTKMIKKVLPGAKVMVDLSGNKVRLRGVSNPIPLIKDENISLHSEQFNYPLVHEHLNVGDIVLTHDSMYSLTVKDVDGSTIIFQSNQDGLLLPNKGFHSPGLCRTLPFLFERDRKMIEFSVEANVDIISLSFVRTANDIKQAKNLIKKAGSNVEIFSKIETAQSLENLDKIFEEVTSVNIDRGDLAADIGILNLPRAQERIVESAQRAGKNIFLATQFLKNMENNPVPLISEMVDLHRTINTGISGIQLSEETAIGKYPAECVEFVFNILNSTP